MKLTEKQKLEIGNAYKWHMPNRTRPPIMPAHPLSIRPQDRDSHPHLYTPADLAEYGVECFWWGMAVAAIESK